MSDNFDWTVAEDEMGPDLFDEVPPSPHGRRWLLALFLLCLIVGGWGVARHQVQQAHNRLIQQAQTVLDFEQQALQNGDGDLFFSVQVEDPAWFAAQLHPRLQALARAGPLVSNARQEGEFLLANVTWEAGAETVQRITFFRHDDGRWLHAPTAPGYWGRTARQKTSWGHLVYPERDQPWAGEIAAFVAQTIAATCARTCLEHHLPLTVTLTTDFSQTAVPRRLHVPSAHLLALAADGGPAAPFWGALRREIETYLSPATIRFAVPPELAQMMDYEAAADAFMAANPHLTVELVPLPQNPTVADLAAFDGAAFPLTEALLAGGGVVDLTDYVNTDPGFDPADFYEQIWQGAWWHGRMWLVPQAGAMNLLYYDKTAYQLAEYPEPSLRWTWEEMAQDMLIVANPYSEKRPNWGFLDTTNDALFSYAFNWENECAEPVTVRCRHALEPAAVIAALAWYQQMAGQPGLMPDLSAYEATEMDNVLLNWQSARRKAVIWVDSPLNYEYRLLLAPLGALSFPGSNRFDGITPLHVQGHFISQGTDNPRAVWEWLKFLSFRPPAPKFRYVPARPSVAEDSRFWQRLPRELGNPMRIAFPFARPVTVAEQRYFTWEQVTAVASGQAAPQAAVQIVPPVAWFQFAPPADN